jgi:quercetin dioxygenase-like cupin family protein
MEIIRREDIAVLSNSGIESEQLLFPENEPSSKVTITRVTVPPRSVNPRHVHEASEQVWVALEGQGHLLLAEGKNLSFKAGEVARFAPGEVHGFKNTGQKPFVYVAVTSPPLNFREAYASDWSRDEEESST